MMLQVLLLMLCAGMGRAARVSRQDVTERNVVPEEPTCTVRITDMMFLLRDGETVGHRCDEYKCVNGTLQNNTFPCETQISYFDDGICHQWSDDKCCCEVVGCLDVHGVLQPKRALYQVTQPDPTNPTCGKYCSCSGGFRFCFVITCGTYQPID